MNRDFYRDWHFVLKNAPDNICLENMIFRDSIQVDFMARKEIILSASANNFIDFSPKENGYIDLKTDPAIPNTILPPTDTHLVHSPTAQAASFNSQSILQTDVIVSPNPASTSIAVTSETNQITRVELIHMLDNSIRIIAAQNFDIIDVTDLPRGRYFILIAVGSQSISKQIELQ